MLDTQSSYIYISLKRLLVCILLILSFIFLFVSDILAEEPTTVTLIYFRATAMGDDIRIEWITGTEFGSAGFFVQRSDSATGPFENISDEMIPAKGNNLGGVDYTIIDENMGNSKTYWYRLVEIETDQTQIEYDDFVTRAIISCQIYLPILYQQS